MNFEECGDVGGCDSLHMAIALRGINCRRVQPVAIVWE